MIAIMTWLLASSSAFARKASHHHHSKRPGLDAMMKAVNKTGRWSRDHGPDPTLPACRCPKPILNKHGVCSETDEGSIV